jgi:hypothetical protein
MFLSSCIHCVCYTAPPYRLLTPVYTDLAVQARMYIPDSQRLVWYDCPPGYRLLGFVAKAGNMPNFYPTQSLFYLRGVCTPITSINASMRQPSNSTSLVMGNSSTQVDPANSDSSSSSSAVSSGSLTYPSMSLNLPRVPWTVSSTSNTLTVGMPGLLDSAPQAGWGPSSNNATLIHSVSCPSGEHVVSITSVLDILPQAPWLVVCSGGGRQLLGVHPPVTGVDAAIQSQEISFLSNTPCLGNLVRKPRQIACRLGM